MLNNAPSYYYNKYSQNQLVGQFVISQNKFNQPDNWKRLNFSGWYIDYCPKLSILETSCDDHESKIIFIGYVIDLKSGQVGIVDEVTQGSEGLFKSVEAYLKNLSGRFICIVKHAERIRIYLDASGSLSLVFSPGQEICASTIMSIPYTAETGDNSELIEELNVANCNQVFSFGLTPRQNIHRLLPNHYLDLINWQAVRYWPAVNFGLKRDSPKMKAIKIARILRRTINIVCNSHPQIYLSLTAGIDSRVLLACARNHLQSIQFFTWELPGTLAKNDMLIATSLAQRFNLNYQLFPFTDATDADKELWLYRTGVSAGAMQGVKLTSVVNSMDKNAYYLPGLGNEFCRGFYWQEDDDATTNLSVQQLVSRIRLPDCPEILKAAQNWHSSLPALNNFELLDMLYLEQRLGCWAGVTPYGHVDGPVRFHPFCNGRILQLMFAMPNEFKRHQLLPLTIINYLWPQLLEHDINQVNYAGISSLKISLIEKLGIKFHLANRRYP